MTAKVCILTVTIANLTIDHSAIFQESQDFLKVF